LDPHRSPVSLSVSGTVVTPGLLLICHASPEWGFGHLNRSLTLAETASRRSIPVLLLVRGPKVAIDERLRQATVPYAVLTGQTSVAEETAWLAARLQAFEESLGSGAVRLVVDHHHLDEAYVQALAVLNRPWLMFTFRDYWIGKPTWVVNIRSGLVRHDGLSYAGTTCLNGPGYAILRDEFAAGCDQPYRPPSENPRVFVTFGGGDDFGASRALLKPLLAALPTFGFDVVTTQANRALGYVQDLAAAEPGRLTVHVSPPSVARIMCRASMAITAGGTTTYELARLGRPFVTVALVENQQVQALAWEASGASRYAGHITDDDIAARVASIAKELVEKPDCCHAMHECAANLVDGQGADRILDALFY